MEPTHDKRPGQRRSRFVLVVVPMCLTLLLGLVAFVRASADASWSGMIERGATLRQKLKAHPLERLPLYGHVESDNAFEQYAKAAAATDVFAGDNYAALRQLLPHGKALGETSTDLRPRWRPVLDALRSGAHGIYAATPLTSDTPGHEPIISLLKFRWVANIAVFEARALRRDGDDLESVRRTLDAATMGADLVRKGTLIRQMIGLSLIAIATSEAWPDTALAELSPEALSELSQGLARLDRILPDCLNMDHEMLFLVDNFQQVHDQSGWGIAGTWRYGFSNRWMFADAFHDHWRTFEAVADRPAASWPERQRQLQEQCDDLSATGNPVSAQMVPTLRSAEQSLRTTITLVRLLRTSVDFHRTGDLQSHADPLGDGPLLVAKGSHGITVRSAGTGLQQRFERVLSR